MNYLIGHFVGDFLFQNDWMAERKKQNSLICAFHCLIYTMWLSIFTQWPWWALLAAGVQHFIQDRTQIIKYWMKFMGQERFMEPPMWPWSQIAVDQIWHLWFLYVIAHYVMLYS